MANKMNSTKVVTGVVRLSYANGWEPASINGSKYMTVHQAKGLEWKKVVVSALPTKKRDGITMSEVFANPQLIQENSADEFVRIYYVACSRAIEDLYIHITEGIDQTVIENSIAKFVNTTGQQIGYEIIT